MKRIPVHIITGFLGSGKTTFLNHFIKELLPERIFVIENEYGAVNVDGGLVMKGVGEVAELSSGCLCCSLADELLDVLAAVAARRHEYDRLIIETTGIADPGSIVQVFLGDSRVSGFFEFQQVICLVEAGQIEEWLSETDEALRQVSLADVVLMNKIDLVTEDQVQEVESLIRGITPQAVIYTGQGGVFPVDKLLRVKAIQLKEELKEHHHTHAGAGVHPSHHITSFTLSFRYPLNLDSLTLDLNRIVLLYRHQVYRVKGFIAIPEYPKRVILQSARSAFVVMDGAAWETDEVRTGKLVFIGRGLKKDAFEKMFNRYMVMPAIKGVD